MNGYKAFYKGKEKDVYAETSYKAQQEAAKLFKAKKSYEVKPAVPYTVYPLAWLKTAKLFSACGGLALPLKDWKEEIQSVFIEMEKAKIITINKYGSIHLKKHLPKGFREQMNRYA